ncbi:MAG: OsmC family protein [Balneolales bacterium]
MQLFDEPVSLGGNNQGPTPVQSVYAALAGCICMTLRIYADTRKIPLKRIDVRVDAEKKPLREDDSRYGELSGMVDKGKVRFIHARIEVHGDLSSEQVDKLNETAGKCPVHKMLKNGAYITHETVAISYTPQV